MFVVPRLDLAGGESRFSYPNAEDPERPHWEPVQVAVQLVEAGARRIQVIDVDRATEAGDNDDQLVKLVDAVGVHIEAGGGVRSMRRIQELLDTGLDRVVLSTLGLTEPDWLKEVGLFFQEKVLLAVDLDEEGQVLVKGRSEPIKADIDLLLERIDGFGLGGIQFNYCDRTPPPDVVDRLAIRLARLETPVWVGGVDVRLADLAAWEHRAVAGVVLGPEAYDDRLDLTKVFGTATKRT